MMRKIVVIGLDAACLDILMPWISQAHLPHLKKLLDNGLYSELRSTIPPWTAPAWTSLVTGKNPGKHGIFDFYRQKGKHGSELVSSLDNKAKAIWEYLSDAGKNVIVLNVPITHPPRKVKGILIPGYMAPDQPHCYPPDILEEVRQSLGEYRVYSKCEIGDISPKEKLEGYIELTKLRKDAAIYLGNRFDWDFLMVQFQRTDAVFHDFFDEKYILKLYEFVDECIGEILEVLGTDANVFVVSDHGIGKCDWVFCVNSWLRREELLKTKGVRKERSLYLQKRRFVDGKHLPHGSGLFNGLLDYLGKMGVSAERISDWLFTLHLGFLKDMVPRSLRSRVPRTAMDVKNTIAHCPSSSSLGIVINSQAREVYHKLRSLLIEKAKALKDPQGNLVFETVLPREDYYYGPYIADAPDIVFVPREMNYCVDHSLRDRLFLPFGRYNHKMNGLFVAAGEDIRSGGNLGSTLSIFDVAPTILHLMDVPVYSDMDGRVLKEIFKEGSEPAQRAVIYQEVDAERGRVGSRIKKLKESGEL
jgi:predicted AlkP superfamily phosphohydrolase/phosphomutase